MKLSTSDISLNDIHEISHYVALMEGWSEERRERVFQDYKSFLKMASTTLTRPSVDVDKLWHEHILNTVSYEQYCLKHFGRIIHHVPCIEESLIGELSKSIGRSLYTIEEAGWFEPQPGLELANCSGGAPPQLDAVGRSNEDFANCSAGYPPVRYETAQLLANCSAGVPNQPSPPSNA